MNIIQWISDRLKERSTWLGIIPLLTLLGVGLSPEQQEAIITAGIAAAGLLLAFTKDNTPTV